MVSLEKINKFANGLTLLANAGVNLDVKLSYELALFKEKAKIYITAFQEVVNGLKGTDAEKNKEIEDLLKKEYEVTIPTIPLSALEKSKSEIPLGAFDFIAEQIVE